MNYSTPTNPGSTGHGLSWKLVRVTQRFSERLTALVVDQFGRGMEIRYDVMGAKGLLPEPGENWIVEHKYGRWVFGAIVTGGDIGVGVEHVNGLTDALDDLSGEIDTAVATLASSVDTRLDKHEAPGKHLWRQSSNATTTVNVPANDTVLTLGSPFAVTNTGIATFSGTQVKFNRMGRWSMLLHVAGVPTVNGSMNLEFLFGTPSPATADGGVLDITTPGTSAEGYCSAVLGWTGWVTAPQAAVAFTCRVYWSGASALPITWTLGMEYLGPF